MNTLMMHLCDVIIFRDIWISNMLLTGIPGMPGSPFLPGRPPPDTDEPGSP